MKTIISLNETEHSFDKVNLVTLNGGYDLYRCKCGLEGKRHGLSENLQVTGKADLIAKCTIPKPFVQPEKKAAKVRITNFTGASSEFKNLINGSEHDVVPCPAEQKSKFGNDIWVMGMSEPVRLLRGEYENI